MTLLSLAACAPACLLGWTVVQLLWPGRAPLRLLHKAALGTGLGLGLASLLYFLRLRLLPGQSGFLPFLVLLLAIGLLAVYSRERRVESPAGMGRPRLSGVQLALLAGLLLAIVLTAISFICYEQASPHGRYDAWAIYNLRARFIDRAGSEWPATFSADSYWNVHADYPLLLPLNIVWLWKALGTESVRAPMALAGIFLFGTAGLLFAATALLRGLGQASLAALLLIAAPVFLDRGASQTADVPVAFFILATCVLLYFYNLEKSPGLLVLAGFTAGLAAWTKNDGLPLIPAAIVAAALAFGPHSLQRRLLWLAAGLALPLAILLYFKVFLAPPSEFLAGQGPGAVGAARYLLILGYMLRGAWELGGWPFPILLALVLHRLVFKPAASDRNGILAIVCLLGVQLASYFAAFVISPYDLAWHLSTSVERLWIQLYPALLFLHFSTVREPETIGVK